MGEIRTLFPYLWRYRRGLALGLGSLILKDLAGAALPLMIRGAIDALNQGTTRLAELMMDSAVTTVLKGKNMDETDLGEGPESPHPVAKAEFE